MINSSFQNNYWSDMYTVRDFGAYMFLHLEVYMMNHQFNY